MTNLTAPERPQIYERLTLAVLGALLILRIIAVIVSPLELYADEAQYWRWGQTLEWGYYSKPPMIAWVIHLTTALFGTHEWSVRLAAPLLHTAAAGLLFLTGRAMLDARAGFFAALLYGLMPSVVLSSNVLSTDGVLMPFWCAGLYLLWRLRSGEGDWVSASLLGGAIGAGMLSKYAMLYFLIGLVLTCLLDAPTRRAILTPRGLVAGVIAALIVAPHFAWNAANDFATVSHTVDNANLGGELFNPENAVTWFADQLGMFGPVSFIALLVGLFLYRSRTGPEASPERWLLCFILPVLVFILGQAVLSRAHANWTATAYPGAALLVAIWFSRGKAVALWASLGLNLLVAGRVLIASVHADLRPRLRSDFASFEPAGQVRVDLGQRGNGCPITRVFQLYIGEGYNPPARTRDWENQFIGEMEFPEPPCPTAAFSGRKGP
jgi:4-amino-4-deoxy-L-arabinose transferase-like glycosyltransferase